MIPPNSLFCATVPGLIRVDYPGKEEYMMEDALEAVYEKLDELESVDLHELSKVFTELREAVEVLESEAIDLVES